MPKSGEKTRKHDLRCVVGGIFAGPVSNGRFGAVRVLRISKYGMRPGCDSGDLLCTSYLGDAPPQIDDVALREVLLRGAASFEQLRAKLAPRRRSKLSEDDFWTLIGSVKHRHRCKGSLS